MAEARIDAELWREERDALDDEWYRAELARQNAKTSPKRPVSSVTYGVDEKNLASTNEEEENRL